MCLIIKKPPGRTLSEAFLANACLRNPDGWGGFYVKEGRVHAQRGMHFAELLTFNRSLPEDSEAFVHLRKATHGHINQDMAHPHLVRPGLLLMHNGSIAHLVPQDSRLSDTAELARCLHDMLAPLQAHQASQMLRSQGFAKLTAPLIEGSMVVLMDAQGAVRLGRTWQAVAQADWPTERHMVGIEVSNTHTWVRTSEPVDAETA